MILSLSVHEFAHAWSAWKLGDDTAKRAGRLTLNPMAHIDPIGTLLLPVLLTIQGGGFFFGWAKPVPVNRVRFRRGISMRTGDILTAVAGPGSNVLIAFIVSGIIIGAGLADGTPVATFLVHMFFINLSLAVFNIIPVPPLDGHYLLPEGIQEMMRRNQMIFFIALVLLINLLGNVLAVPVSMLQKLLVGFWNAVFGVFGG